MPLTVGLDGGYVHSCTQSSRKEGWFEVIAGKSVTAEGASKRFAFVNNQVVSKRMVKKQQMRWSQQGAHLLLQIRTRVLNDELREIFDR
jgi:hypothetical protein